MPRITLDTWFQRACIVVTSVFIYTTGMLNNRREFNYDHAVTSTASGPLSDTVIPSVLPIQEVFNTYTRSNSTLSKLFSFFFVVFFSFSSKAKLIPLLSVRRWGRSSLPIPFQKI